MTPDEVPDELVQLAMNVLDPADPESPAEWEVATILAAALPRFGYLALLWASYAIDGLEYIGELPEDSTNPEAEAAYADYANRTSTSEWLRDYAEKTYT